ncbi:hypothetical protein [Psychrobacillus sp. NPDC093180]|uniref:hypothetical protein n=1 Tax=Psychrobacillus sp. NPDC093180 TaxID=3364489 RepID=UPI0038133290
MSNFKFYINDGDGIIKENLFGSTQTTDHTPKPRNGTQVAEALIENIYVTQKGSYKDLTEKWDITNVGSELIFTSKAEKAYKDAQFKVNEKENRAEIKGEMFLKNLGNVGVTGKKEVNILSVIGTAVTNGKLDVTFDDGTKVTKTITVAKGDTKETIAAKISTAFQNLTDWDVTNTAGTAKVEYKAKAEASDKDVKVTIINK